MTGTIRKWAVADGRDALGTVRLDDSGKFIAIDVDGKTLGKFSRLLEAANAFDDAKEALTNMITQTNRDIKKALNALMKACGLSGESGTEQLYEILSGIVLERDLEIRATVEESHANGLCYDVNALLADAVAEVLSQTSDPVNLT
jgi:chemotaxis regulatin CheY-phosphate phosphatase CheZ